MKHLKISTASFQEDQPQFVELMTCCTELWNNASGDEFSISNRLLQWKKSVSNAENSTIFLAKVSEIPVGFLLASFDASLSVAYIDALAVLPDSQRQGVGSHLIEALFAFVESSQIEAISVQVGGGPQSLLPGVPVSSEATQFFEHRSFTENSDPVEYSWLNVATYHPPANLKELPISAHPAQLGQKNYIGDFLRQNPSMHSRQLENYVQNGRRLSDLMLLWSENGLEGVCQLGFEDSPLPIENSFPYPLPRPWAQIQSIVMPDNLNYDYLSSLLDAALRRLHNTGVNSLVFTQPMAQVIREQFAIQTYQRFQPMCKRFAI